MVVGGSNSEGLLDDVELISPTPNEECSKAVQRISGKTKIVLYLSGLNKMGANKTKALCNNKGIHLAQE